MNALIGIVLIGIVASMGSALFYMMSPGERSNEAVAKALTFRIALSVTLFVLLMVLWLAGVIEPHGVTR